MTRKKPRRDDSVVAAFFSWQKRFRECLLAHPATRKNPRLFLLGYAMSDMFDWEDRSCDPSRETLAERIGVDVRSITTLTGILAKENFIKIKRRRNTSAIYTGSIPQEVKSASHPEVKSAAVPDDTTGGITDGQEVKSSRFRKGSGLPFGKGSGLPPNVVFEHSSERKGGGANAPAAHDTDHSSDYFGSGTIDHIEDAPSFAPEGATGASGIFRSGDSCQNLMLRIDLLAPITFASDEAMNELVDYIARQALRMGADDKVSASLRRVIRELAKRGQLTRAQAEEELRRFAQKTGGQHAQKS